MPEADGRDEGAAHVGVVGFEEGQGGVHRANEVDTGVGVDEIFAVLEFVECLVDDVRLPQPQARPAIRVHNLVVFAKKLFVDEGAVEGIALVELAVLYRGITSPPFGFCTAFVSVGNVDFTSIYNV